METCVSAMQISFMGHNLIKDWSENPPVSTFDGWSKNDLPYLSAAGVIGPHQFSMCTTCRELDLMNLICSFQLDIFCDSMKSPQLLAAKIKKNIAAHWFYCMHAKLKYEQYYYYLSMDKTLICFPGYVYLQPGMSPEIFSFKDCNIQQNSEQLKHNQDFLTFPYIRNNVTGPIYD